MIELQRVYYDEDYGMGYGHRKVGLRIGDQIVWFASWNCPSSQEEREKFRQIEDLVADIVAKWGTVTQGRWTSGNADASSNGSRR